MTKLSKITSRNNALVHSSAGGALARSLRSWWLVPLVFLFVYREPLKQLFRDWQQLPDYSHGLLVPFILGYLIYDKRKLLPQIEYRPSGWGLALVIASQVMNVIGFLAAEYSLQRFSMVIAIVGAIVYLAGWRMLHALRLVLLIFVLAIPLPEIVLNAIAGPLQTVASAWAEMVLTVLNIPVYREGNILVLTNQTLNVTEACSGVRSLVSLFTLSLLFSYFLPARIWIRAVFAASAVPLAVIFNVMRVAGSGILAQHFGSRLAEGFFHAFAGWAVFLGAFAMLYLELTLLLKLKQNSSEAA